jgi:aspartyl protease family protein
MSDHQGPWSSLPPPPAPRRPTRNWRGLVFIGIIGACLALVVWLSRLFPMHLAASDWTSPAINIGFAALIGASLLSRRLKLGQAMRYVATWGVVVGVLALGYVYRDDAVDAFYRVRSALIPAYAMRAGPHTVVLSESQGGGYQVVAQVNGQPITFVIDTGASDIVLSPADARRLGADFGALRFDRRYETANGAGLGADWRVESLEVGPIRLADLPVSVNQATMSRSLLGMAFLRRLDSFEFKGGQLILRGRPLQ